VATLKVCYPSISIQGNNPATINVGHTYTDLGAIVHDNQGHDLTYKTFLNGALVSNIVIDTTQVATDTIDYVATDTLGQYLNEHPHDNCRECNIDNYSVGSSYL
jgi:hypothetical protein